ncbi:DUF6440 family protein [Evansella clarkii]|uniref:DUF6440 family protein n=1 Tax=Evansella clarkii TaxID=79879 RepID=UPI0009976A19|nr:DUF6440 family protein [Evansella clarkii]
MSQKLILIFLLMLLPACASPTEGSEPASERFGVNGTTIITDGETGCKYLFFKNGYGGGLSPLYDENGELYCGMKGEDNHE